MATWYAQNSSVNIDSVNQWNSAANGSGSWLTWASLGASDILLANGKTNITVNVNVTCASIRNTTLSGATSGGTMICSAAVTITCDLYSVTGVQLLTLSHTTGNTVAIIGNLYGADVGSVCYTVRNTSTGPLTITGNLGTAGTGGGCLECPGSGTVTITGNVTGCGSTNITIINLNAASCTLNVTGNVTGGSGSFTRAINVSAGTLVVTGAVAGGGGSGISPGIYSTATQALTVIGDCTAGSANAAVLIAYSSTSGTPCQFNHTGNMIAETNGYPGVAFAGKYLIHTSNTLTHTYRVNNSGSAGSARSLYTGGVNLNQPAIANVRSGTVYGASNEYTGTLAVPSASLVALGVSTDNTTGTYNPQPALLIDTTIAVRTSETVFTLTAGSSDDSTYVGQTVIVTKNGSTTRKEVGTVSAYVGSTKQVTLSSDPGVMTIAAGDAVCIFAGSSSGGGGGGLDAAGVRAAVGLASANLDTQLSGISNKTTNLPASPAAVGSLMGLSDGAITAAKIAASALDNKGNWNVGKTGYTVSTVSDKTGYSLTAGTGLGNQTANITGDLSGSVGSVAGAVALDSAARVKLDASQPDYAPALAATALSTAVWTSTIAGRIDAAISSRSTYAGGAVASVTAAVTLESATSTQITNIENASGYLLAVLAGECADPQTASETYAITVFGSTFTVDMAGQTSTGTRTAPTLTKV